MSIVTTSHLEIAMNHPIADPRKPTTTSIGVLGRQFAHKLRFVASIAITLGGAGVLVSDLIRLLPSFG